MNGSRKGLRDLAVEVLILKRVGHLHRHPVEREDPEVGPRTAKNDLARERSKDRSQKKGGVAAADLLPPSPSGGKSLHRRVVVASVVDPKIEKGDPLVEHPRADQGLPKGEFEGVEVQEESDAGREVQPRRTSREVLHREGRAHLGRPQEEERNEGREARRGRESAAHALPAPEDLRRPCRAITMLRNANRPTLYIPRLLLRL